jgi:hypothetical protein
MRSSVSKSAREGAPVLLKLLMSLKTLPTPKSTGTWVHF